MSELVLKINKGPRYDDGDILHAFNNRRIKCVNAEHLCFQKGPDRRLVGLNKNGLLNNNDIAKDFMEATHEFKFIHTGKKKLKIVRLSDGESINILSNKPFTNFNGKVQAMDIEMFIARRKKALVAPGGNGLPIFEANKREFWYGGKKDFSDANLSKVWFAISNKLGHTDKDFPHWPAGKRDLEICLFLPVDDFEDAEANELQSSEVDDTDPENPKTVFKRKHNVNWHSLLDHIHETEPRILDKNTLIDVRGQCDALVKSQIVCKKNCQ